MSALRQIRALVQFRDLPIRENLLKLKASDQLFNLNKNLVYKCGEKDFKFKLVRRFFMEVKTKNGRCKTLRQE